MLAYAGVPLTLPGGAIGVLAVADVKPRDWKRRETAVLEELAQSARVELELRAELEALQRLRGLFETAPVAISANDLEGRSLLRNPAAEQLGGEQPLNVVEFPLTDLAGEAYGTGAIGVPEAPQRFVHAFDDAPTGMAMIGTDGRFRLVNAALCKLLGRTEAELLQRTLAKTIHPEEWSVRKRLFERMLTGEIRTHQTQGRVVTGQGEARWMLVNATALTDDGGWPTEFFVQFQDITEQARGQQLLGARHDVTRVLAQATGVEQAAPLLLEALGANLGWEVGTLWLADEDSGELAAVASWRHRAFERRRCPQVGELTLEDLPVRVTHSGQPVWTEALMAGAASPRASAIAAAGLSGAVCLPIVAGDGCLGAMEFYCHELEEPDEQLRELLATIGMPIGLFIERARATRALAAARDEALEATADEVAVPGHHEPRAAHADERRDRDGRAAARHRPERGAAPLRGHGALSSGDALLTIINDILDLSKIEAGKLELEHAEFDLSEAVDAAVELLAEQARGKGLELRAFIERRAPRRVVGDRFRLQQVVTNLLSNAVKFTSEGGITVRVTEGEPTRRGQRVRFEVADTGIGIEPAAVARLFEPFNQADSSTTRTYGGTGLGLSICSELVEMMGGEIGAHGEPGRGSTFWFTADLALPEPAAEPEPAAPEPAPAEVAILVVDDNAVNRMVAAEMLRKRGHRVEVAKDGAEAVEAAARRALRGHPHGLPHADHGRLRGDPRDPRRRGRRRSARRSWR